MVPHGNVILKLNVSGTEHGEEDFVLRLISPSRINAEGPGSTDFGVEFKP